MHACYLNSARELRKETLFVLLLELRTVEFGATSPHGKQGRNRSVITAENLSKRYKNTTAVDGISFFVKPGVITGFLGPNGAGKSTTMRLILGLDRPTGGEVTVNGKKYVTSPAPIAEIGALLDAGSADKARSARNHLLALGATVGIKAGRVDELLEVVGLAEVGRARVKSYSLGMTQRLGIAGALLADPAVVILDEPVNGLDPDGILWIRGLLKDLAAQGRTVFLSSHLMSEMEQTADHLLVIGRGKIIADEPMSDFIARANTNCVRVAGADQGKLSALLTEKGATITLTEDGRLEAYGLTAREVGIAANEARLALFELTEVAPSLEEAFMELTKDSVEFHGTATGDKVGSK